MTEFESIESKLHTLIEQHEQLNDRDSIVLYAGTNTMNPRARALLASSIGGRPSLGAPGAKYNKGMQHAERIEVMCIDLLKRLFRAKHVEHRVPSGSIANLYAYMAVCKPGDAILSFADAAAGHPTHHTVGAAGLYGLRVHEMPFDTARMDVDVVKLRETARLIRPKLMIVAGSMCLFPYSLREVRAVADEVGAKVMYDAAHMGGMIVGGQFQDPLREGAHLMTGSTYKSFGGPTSGFVVTDDDALAARISEIAYPGLTANFDMSKTAAMVIAAMDLLEHGAAYARMCVANAEVLAKALHQQGLDVFSVNGRPEFASPFTASQHVALRATALGGGDAACKRLEQANVIATGIGLPGPTVASDYNGIRIGTQEITRWGMTPDHMPDVAGFVARVLVRGEPAGHVRNDVIAFRRDFQTLRYIR